MLAHVAAGTGDLRPGRGRHDRLRARLHPLLEDVAAPKKEAKNQGAAPTRRSLDRSWPVKLGGSFSHDARVPAPPDTPVRLVNESGKTVGRTSASNAVRMAAALEPRNGPLKILPA